VKSQSEQDLIKFNIIIEAFRQLDYDLVNLSEKDIEIAQNLGLLSNPIVGFISPYGTGEKISGGFRNQYLLKGKYITISVLTFNVETSSIKQIREVFPREPGQQSVNILIINRCDDAIISSIAEMGTVDCVVCPAESDEPMVIGDPNKRPLVFSVGRFGRYVCRLQITEDRGQITEAAGGEDKLKLSFHAIPIEEDLEEEASLVQLYKDYQKFVKEANLLEKHPRFALPNALQYVGSISCGYCHDYEYEKWSDKSHARAYATLERVGSQYDPECIACHVVGVQYEGGFVSKGKAGYLKNVGCESCHGPGSEHIRTLGNSQPAEPRLDCTDCHTPEQSTNYAGNEQLYFEKIIHWREPNAVGDVKEKGEPED
jgi:nitrate/TMAO reductase-like tetraheme cytochrome c subunit